MKELLRKIFEEEIAEARTKGSKLKTIEQVCKKLKKGMAVPDIADVLEEDLSVVEKIVSVAEDFAPEYDVNAIFGRLEEVITIKSEKFSNLNFANKTISYEEAVKNKSVPDLVMKAFSGNTEICVKSAEKDPDSGRMKVEMQLRKDNYAVVIDPAKTKEFIEEMAAYTQSRPADYWEECKKSKKSISSTNMKKLCNGD